MTTRTFSLAIAFASLGLTSVASAQANPTAARPPNLLLIISDDQSYQDLGIVDGNARTPNLDKLARDGMIFSRAYVTCPQCAPSRSSFVTGRSPISLGTSRFPAPLPRWVPIYQEVIEPLGYFTGMAGRVHHLDGNAWSSKDIQDLYAAKNLGDVRSRLDFSKEVEGSGTEPAYRGECLSQFREALDAAGTKPFAIQIGFSDPHRPWDGKEIPDPVEPKTLKLPPFYPDHPAVRRDFADYLDEINRLDHSVGDVLAEIEKRGQTNNTLVIFIGDNGGSQLRGKATLWENGIRVPLIARWPGHVAAGSKSEALISGEDLAPTFIEAAGATPPKSMTGKSFLPLLEGKPYEPRAYVYSERGPHADGLPINQAAFDLGRTIIGPRYKLIYNVTWNQPYWQTDATKSPMWKATLQLAADGKLSPRLKELYLSPTRPMFELYDLQTDRWEMTNLIDDKDHADVVKKLKRDLMLWMQGEQDFVPIPTGGSWGAPRLPSPGEPMPEVEATTRPSTKPATPE